MTALAALMMTAVVMTTTLRRGTRRGETLEATVARAIDAAFSQFGRELEG